MEQKNFETAEAKEIDSTEVNCVEEVSETINVEDTFVQSEFLNEHDIVVNENLAEIPDKKKTNKLRIIIPAVLSVLVIVVVCIIFLSGKNGDKEYDANYNFKDKAYALCYSEDKTLVVQGDKLVGTINEYVYTEAESFDGGTTLLKTYAKNLYVACEDNVKHVSENVARSSVASHGEYFAYTDTSDKLYRAKTGSDEKTFIAEGVSSFQISPDGKNLVYTVGKYDDTDGKQKMYYYNGQESVVIADEYYYAWGISNNGEYIYAENLQSDAYVFTKQGKNSKKLIESVTNPIRIGYTKVFNADNTQVIFYNDDATYICTKGEDVVKLGDVYLSPIYPRDIAQTVGVSGPSIDVDNLLNTVYGMYNFDHSEYPKLCFVGNDYRVTELTGDYTYGEIQMSRNGEYVYYFSEKHMLDQHELSRVKVNKDAVPQVVADEIFYYFINYSGNEVYYSDLKSDIYYINGKSEPMVIVEDAAGFQMTSKDILLIYSDYNYIVDDIGASRHTNTICAYKNGKKVKVIIEEAWDSKVIYGTAMYKFGSSDYYDLFASTGDGEYKRIALGLKNVD